MSTTDDLYNVIGRVVHKSQQMEWSLAYLNLLMRETKGVQTKDSGDTSFPYLSKETMGARLNELFKTLNLDNSLKKPLIVSLQERNYIVHNIFNDGPGVFLTKEGRKQLVDRTTSALKHMEHGNELLVQFVKLSVEANNQTNNFNEVGEKVKSTYEADE